MRLHSTANVSGIDRLLIGRIATTPPATEAADTIMLLRDGDAMPSGSKGYLATVALDNARVPAGVPAATGVRGLDYLTNGDVVSVDPNGLVRVLYRRSSPHNFILMTEQCNSYCLMCSQPPRKVADQDRIAGHLRLIDLIDPETAELGVTGGEPTLFGADFLRLVAHAKECLPRTALHVLTNGRLFYYRKFAERLGAIGHPDLMLGIPLYSDIDSEHDYVVQAKGAFEETVTGLQHLARHGVRVEIRIVLHRQTIPRLVQLAEYLTRNTPFAAHVTFMGLEMFGFTNKNLEELWIDPCDYQAQLRDAVMLLHASGMNVSIYNHQLCILHEELWPFARRSISDWKNTYLPECTSCVVKTRCGGFFASGTKRRSAFIRPMQGFTNLV